MFKKFYSNDDIKKSCGNCTKLRLKTSRNGNQYYFCDSYQMPVFCVINLCEHEIEEAENKAIDRMEAGIVRAERGFDE